MLQEGVPQHQPARDHDEVRALLSARPRPGPKGKFTPEEARQARRLGVVVVLVAGFFVVELAGALVARSNVLIADAIHLLMDVFALGMSLVAMRVAVRRPTPRFTFGLRRAEPVAATFNAVLVLVATAEIVRRAIAALRGHLHPEVGIMLWVAVAALVVNGVSAWLLHGVIHEHGHGDHGHEHDEHGHGHAHAHETRAGHELNLRGVTLHLLGDVLGSLAALVAAVVLRLGGPSAADPIASLVVAVILVAGAVRLLRDALLVLLEAAPPHLDVHGIRQVIEAHPGVVGVHDMHVWTLGAGHDAIIVHVHAEDDHAYGTPGGASLSSTLCEKIRSTYRVEYVTVQVESVSEACAAPRSRFDLTPHPPLPSGRGEEE